MDTIRPFDKPATEKAAYYEAFLGRIAPIVPASQRESQDLSDHLVKMIEDGLQEYEKKTAGSKRW